MRLCPHISLPKLIVCSVALVMGLTMFAAPASATAHDNTSVTVHMENSQGDSAGSVRVVRLVKGTLFIMNLKNLPAGKHAFHIHLQGQCKPPDFKSAGGPVKPADNDANGLLDIYVPQQHTAEAEIFVPWLKLGQSTSNRQNASAQSADGQSPFALLGGGGSTIVIHKNPDDHDTVPPNHTGPRIACGVIG